MSINLNTTTSSISPLPPLSLNDEGDIVSNIFSSHSSEFDPDALFSLNTPTYRISLVPIKSSSPSTDSSMPAKDSASKTDSSKKARYEQLPSSTSALPLDHSLFLLDSSNRITPRQAKSEKRGLQNPLAKPFSPSTLLRSDTLAASSSSTSTTSSSRSTHSSIKKRKYEELSRAVSSWQSSHSSTLTEGTSRIAPHPEGGKMREVPHILDPIYPEILTNQLIINQLMTNHLQILQNAIQSQTLAYLQEKFSPALMPAVQEERTPGLQLLSLHQNDLQYTTASMLHSICTPCLTDTLLRAHAAIYSSRKIFSYSGYYCTMPLTTRPSI